MTRHKPSKAVATGVIRRNARLSQCQLDERILTPMPSHGSSRRREAALNRANAKASKSRDFDPAGPITTKFSKTDHSKIPN
jgi:hypothetical protein